MHARNATYDEGARPLFAANRDRLTRGAILTTYEVNNASSLYQLFFG